MEMIHYRKALSRQWKLDLGVDESKHEGSENVNQVTIHDKDGNIEYEGPCPQEDKLTQAEEFGFINDDCEYPSPQPTLATPELKLATGPVTYHFSPPTEVATPTSSTSSRSRAIIPHIPQGFYQCKEAPRGTNLPNERIFRGITPRLPPNGANEAVEVTLENDEVQVTEEVITLDKHGRHGDQPCWNYTLQGSQGRHMPESSRNTGRLQQNVVPPGDLPTGNQRTDYIRPRPSRPITGGKKVMHNAHGGCATSRPRETPPALEENFHLRHVGLPAIRPSGLEGKFTWMSWVMRETNRSLHTLSTEARTTRDLAINNAHRYRELSDRFNHREDANAREKDTLIQEVRKLRQTDELILRKINEAEDAEALDRDGNK